MKKFLKYFVIEFVIILLISSLGYWILKVPFNMFQVLLSTTTSSAVIAFALTVTRL